MDYPIYALITCVATTIVATLISFPVINQVLTKQNTPPVKNKWN